jgi:hypothetical protein
MDSEEKKIWVNALRSGTYIQTRYVLYNPKKSEESGKLHMCCLGVHQHVCGTTLEHMRNVPMPQCLGHQAQGNGLGKNSNGTDYELILADMNESIEKNL